MIRCRTLCHRYEDLVSYVCVVPMGAEEGAHHDRVHPAVLRNALLGFRLLQYKVFERVAAALLDGSDERVRDHRSDHSLQ